MTSEFPKNSAFTISVDVTEAARRFLATEGGRPLAVGKTEPLRDLQAMEDLTQEAQLDIETHDAEAALARLDEVLRLLRR